MSTIVTFDTRPIDVCLRRGPCDCAGCLTLAARIRRSPKLMAVIVADHADVLAEIEALSPPPSNKLPEGKACVDCMYLYRCMDLGVRKSTATDVTCDWTPSRFQEAIRCLCTPMVDDDKIVHGILCPMAPPLESL